MSVRIMVVLLAAVYLLLPATAVGATYSCTTVDRSAKAFASGSVSVAEKDKNCEFSINGVTSREAYSTGWAEALGRIAESMRSGWTDLGEEEMYDLLVGPFDVTQASKYDFHESVRSLGFLHSFNECLRQFAEGASYVGLPELNESELWAQDGFECMSISAPEGEAYFGSVVVQNFVGLAIRHSFAESSYTLYLPLDYLRWIAEVRPRPFFY